MQFFKATFVELASNVALLNQQSTTKEGAHSLTIAINDISLLFFTYILDDINE
jgi:hypothetical protein